MGVLGVRVALLGCLWLACVGVRGVDALKIRNVHFVYPIDVVAASDSGTWSSSLTHDRLSCTENVDHKTLDYFDSLLCLLPWVSNGCEALWGSRSILIEVLGSVEILRLSHPVREPSDSGVALNATRWLLLSSPSAHTAAKEIVQVAAEPLYLCARSNDWNEESANLTLSFRHAHIRERDRAQFHERLAYHLILLCAVASAWLLPYIVALCVGILAFRHGLQKIMILGGISSVLLCLTPLMLTSKHRHHAKLYLHYFFTSVQAEEARQLIKKRTPLFQALFFSSALLCFGCVGSYMVYHYFGIDRDMRNTLLKWSIAVSLSWLSFFICRSFERFFSEWIWIGISVAMAKTVEEQLNPLSRDKAALGLFALSLVMVQGLKQVYRLREIKRLFKLIDKQCERFGLPPMRRLRGKTD